MAAHPPVGHTAPATSESVTHLSLGFLSPRCRYHKEGHPSTLPGGPWAPSSTAAHEGAAPHPLYLGCPWTPLQLFMWQERGFWLCCLLPVTLPAADMSEGQEGQV